MLVKKISDKFDLDMFIEKALDGSLGQELKVQSDRMKKDSHTTFGAVMSAPVHDKAQDDAHINSLPER